MIISHILSTSFNNGLLTDLLFLTVRYKNIIELCILFIAISKNLISLRKSKYGLRGDKVLSTPKVNTTRKGLKSMRYFAPRQWNNLDNSIRSQAGTTDVVRTIRNETFEHSI